MHEHCGFPMMGQQAPTPPQQDWGVCCSSRPHSSTSMELDMNMAMMSLGPSPSQPSGPSVLLPPQGPGPSCSLPPPQITMSRQKESHMMRYDLSIENFNNKLVCVS